MKLVLCLFAVWCWWVADASVRMQQRKLMEVHKHLRSVVTVLQNSPMMITTPPENIEECCSLSALRCFRDNIRDNFNTTENPLKKLYRSLNNSLTEGGLDFCDSRNATCQDCNSHPKERVGEFLSRLDSLIQKGMNKLKRS